MSGIVTIGETMAAFCPKEGGMLRYAEKYGMRAAGAESNTAIGVCKLGHPAAWISALGDDEFGHFVLYTVRAEGVNCSGVYMEPDSFTGVMFKELRSRDTGVYYYREHSAASKMSFEKLPNELIRQADILHLTGITPVLSKNCKEMMDYLFAFSNENGIMISFDPNIRKRLWRNKDYREIIAQYVCKSQIVLIGMDEAKELFQTTDIKEIRERIFCEGCVTYAAIKDGGNGAIVYDQTNSFDIEPFPCQPVDPVGAGDAFNAGFLSGILEGKTIEECGRMGGICGALATETRGDFEGYPDRKKLEQLLKGATEIYR